jgi:hypothetical protein
VLQLNIELSPRRSRESSKRPFTDAAYHREALTGEPEIPSRDVVQRIQCHDDVREMNRTEVLGEIDPKVD